MREHVIVQNTAQEAVITAHQTHTNQAAPNAGLAQEYATMQNIVQALAHHVLLIHSNQAAQYAG